MGLTFVSSGDMSPLTNIRLLNFRREVNALAHVITDECNSCGVCVEDCPTEAISEGSEIYVIDSALCDDCGDCVEECPVECIIPGT